MIRFLYVCNYVLIIYVTVACIIVRRLLISVQKWQSSGMADTHEYWSQHDAHLVYLHIWFFAVSKKNQLCNSFTVACIIVRRFLISVHKWQFSDMTATGHLWILVPTWCPPCIFTNFSWAKSHNFFIKQKSKFTEIFNICWKHVPFILCRSCFGRN